MNVVICDDHRLFSDALARVLSARAWNIVDCAIDPAHAVAAVARGHVDACLMDLSFPDGDTGIEGIVSIHQASPDTRVVVLTFHFCFSGRKASFLVKLGRRFRVLPRAGVCSRRLYEAPPL